MKPKHQIYRRVALTSALALSVSSASAASYYWDTTATGTWGNTANWWTTPTGTVSTLVPGSGDTAAFNGTGVNGAETVQLDNSYSIGGLTFVNTGTTTIESSSTTSEALTIGTGGITINSGVGAVTIGNATDPSTVTLGGAQSWTNNSSNTFTEVGAVTNGGYLLTMAGAGGISITGAITGTGGLTKTGSGTLSLYGANSTGDVTISSGTIFTENNNTFGNLSLTGTLDLGGLNAAYTTNISGLTGSGSITTNNSGGYARTLNVGNGNATSTFSGIITQAGNRGLNFNKVGSGTLILSGSTSNVQGGGSGTFATNVQGGTLVLDMTNAVALPGNVTVSSGATLQLSGTGGNQIADTATVGVSSGGVFDLAGQSETTSTVSLAGTGISSGGALINSVAATTSTLTAPVSLTATTTLGGAGNITVNGAISGGNGLTYAGTGTLTLAGTNTYTGATAVTSGTMSVTGAIGSGGGSAVSTSGTGTLTVSGLDGLTGTSSLTVGTGTTATLTAANNNSGATSVTGTLNLQDPNSVVSSAVTLNSGSTLLLRNNSSNSFNTNGVVTLATVNGSPTFGFDVNNNGSGTGSTLTLANGISYATPNTTAGTRTTTIDVTGGNGYTLALPMVNFVNSDTYSSGSTRAFVMDFNPTTANVSLGNMTFSGTGNRATLALTLGGTSTGNVVTGAISGSTNGGTVTISGGTWTFTGANSYTSGATSISSGATLQIGNGGTSGSLPTGSSISNSGTLVFDRSNTVTEGTDFANAIGGTGGAVTQAGSGTLVLGGTNTYTGATTVAAGKLSVTGSLGTTAVEVKSSASLAGMGSLGGSVTVDSGGHLAYALASAPGSQTSQSISGTLNLGSGTIIDLSASSAPAAGTYVLATAAGGINGTPGTVNLPSGVTGTLSVSGKNLQLVIPTLSGFATWIAGFSGLSDTTPGGNPAHDGISNLMKYVLNGDPTKSDTSILPG